MPPVNRNLNMQSRRALYMLKREYGARIDIYKLVSADVDVRTGNRTVNKTVYPITRAIVMPEIVDRAVKQSISLISSNKEFVTGGTHDKGTRDFIIDRRDCPDLPELTQDDWLVYDGDKYQIKTVEDFEVHAGWVVTATKQVGETPEQIVLSRADHFLSLQSVATFTVG